MKPLSRSQTSNRVKNMSDFLNLYSSELVNCLCLSHFASFLALQTFCGIQPLKVP